MPVVLGRSLGPLTMTVFLDPYVTVLRPVVIILSLPAILLTLGLFTVIVNGFMVYVSLLLAPGLHMTFWNSVLTGIVLSLVNYIVSSALELQYARRREER